MDQLKSRKFIMAVVAALVAFGNAFFDWKLSIDQVNQILVPLLAFIAVEGTADAVTRFKQPGGIDRSKQK